MKTLKITLTLAAVALLTVSGVKSDDFVVDNDNNIHQPTKVDLIAHGKKKKSKVPTQG